MPPGTVAPLGVSIPVSPERSSPTRPSPGVPTSVNPREAPGGLSSAERLLAVTLPSVSSYCPRNSTSNETTLSDRGFPSSKHHVQGASDVVVFRPLTSHTKQGS